MNKKIILTGGGTAGHVSVNLGLIPRLSREGWTIDYVGSEEGIERDLVSDFPQVTYHAIPTGKFRRRRNWENIKANIGDVGHVFSGIKEAKTLVKKIKPNIVFSKGGFVSVPVVFAASRLGVPVIAHESDLTPGLANKLSAPFSRKILTTFEKTLDYLPKNKGLYLGPIIRDQIKEGSREKGLEIFGFDGKKPILLILGGSSGAVRVNEAIWANLDSLLDTFDILHGVGKGKGREELNRPGYRQVEFIREDMNHALAMADLIISRAGSNAIFEFLYYRKPMVLVPYRLGSRGDQVDNAQVFVDRGFALSLNDQTMSRDDFLEGVNEVWIKREDFIRAQSDFAFEDGLGKICQILDEDQMPYSSRS